MRYLIRLRKVRFIFIIFKNSERLTLVLFHHDFLSQSPAQYEALQVRCDGQLALAVVGNYLDPVPFAQAHRQQSHFGPGPAPDVADDEALSGFGHCQRHQLNSFLQAAVADTVDFKFVLQHMKPLGCGYLDLQLLDSLLFELQDLSAFGADHVIMVLTQMAMLVKNHAIIEAAPAGKAEVAHQLKGFPNEFRIQLPAILFQKLVDSLDGHVLFGLQKSLQHLEPIFEIVDMLLFEQLFKLPFFLEMYLFHFFISQTRYASLSAVSGNIIGGAVAAGAITGLCIGRIFFGGSLAHSMTCHAHYPFKIFRFAFRTPEFNLLFLVPQQKLKAVVAFQTSEFIDWHIVFLFPYLF